MTNRSEAGAKPFSEASTRSSHGCRQTGDRRPSDSASRQFGCPTAGLACHHGTRGGVSTLAVRDSRCNSNASECVDAACQIFATCMNIKPRLRDALLERSVVPA